MTIINEPNININILGADEPIGDNPQKVLFIGRHEPNNSNSNNGELYQDMQSYTQASSLFGGNSELATMIKAGRNINKKTQFDCISYDPMGATVSTANITFTSKGGNANFSQGAFNIILGSKSRNDFNFMVEYEDKATPQDVANALIKAVNKVGRPLDFPFKDLVIDTTNNNQVNLETVNYGEDSKTTPIIIESNTNNDLKIVISDYKGGEDNTSQINYDDLKETIKNRRYQTIISSSIVEPMEIASEVLDPRFNLDNHILDGVAIFAKSSNVQDLVNKYSMANSQSLVIFADKQVSKDDYKGSSYGEINYIISAQIGAIRALRLTDGADISNIITSNGQLDNVGGVGISTLPYFNTLLPYVSVQQDLSLGYSDEDIAILNSSGISVYGNNTGNTGVVLGETLTTYKTDNAGNKDLSFKFLNYVDTATSAREYMFNNGKKDLAQTRLTNGDLIQGRASINKGGIQGLFAGYYKELAEPQFALTPSGEKEKLFFKQHLNVVVDEIKGSTTVGMKLPIVTQLRSLVVSFNLSFSNN